MTYAVNQAFPLMVSGIGSAPSFYFFSSVCAFSFVWIWLYVFETKGRSLEQIQLLLKGETVDEETAEASVKIKSLKE